MVEAELHCHFPAEGVFAVGKAAGDKVVEDKVAVGYTAPVGTVVENMVVVEQY